MQLFNFVMNWQTFWIKCFLQQSSKVNNGNNETQNKPFSKKLAPHETFKKSNKSISLNKHNNVNIW